MTATPEPLLLDHITRRYEVVRAPLLELRRLVKRHVTLGSGHRLVVAAPPDTPLRLGETVRLTWPADRGRCVGD